MTPLCFGYVTTLDPDSSICSACSEFVACQRQVLNVLHELGEEMDVSDLVHIAVRDTNHNDDHPVLRTTNNGVLSDAEAGKKRTRFELTSAQKQKVDEIKTRYAKSERLVRAIFKNGIDLKRTLSRRINPFYDIKSHQYMREVCDLLISGGYTRDQLRKSLGQKFNWTYGTANSHVLTVVHALDALEITEEHKGVIRLKEVECH